MPRNGLGADAEVGSEGLSYCVKGWKAPSAKNFLKVLSRSVSQDTAKSTRLITVVNQSQYCI